MAVRFNDPKFQSRLQQVISIALMLAVAGLLAWLSTRYDYAADWTANRSNSLSEPSIKLLATMTDPVSITAYLYPDQTLRREISAYVERYQRHKPDITLSFVDPAKAPEQVRELGIAASGEVLVEYQGRREKLRVISEPALSAALQRLAFAGESWIMFLSGHGERSTEGQAQADYGQLAKELRDKGLKVQALNLARTPTIPENTAVLVIASPQSNLLPGEVQLVRDYVKKGGSLLWLADPGTLAGLQPLASASTCPMAPRSTRTSSCSAPAIRPWRWSWTTASIRSPRTSTTSRCFPSRAPSARARIPPGRPRRCSARPSAAGWRAARCRSRCAWTRRPATSAAR
jgi:hypothetical protein